MRYTNRSIPIDLASETQSGLRRTADEYQASKKYLIGFWDEAFRCGEDKAIIAKFRKDCMPTAGDAIRQLIYDSDSRQVSEWVCSMKVCQQIVEMQNPDVLFVALRGASPIMAAIEAFSPAGTFDRVARIPLPIGEMITGDKNFAPFGNNAKTKQDIVRGILDMIPGCLEVERPLLIDEVQSGKTASVASRVLTVELMRKFGDSIKLNMVVAQDNRVKTRPLTHEYRNLSTNRDPSGNSLPITVFPIHTALFTTDRYFLLDRIIEPNPHQSDEGIANRLILVPNHHGRTLIKGLVNCYLHSEQALQMVEDLAKNPCHVLPCADKLRPLEAMCREFLIDNSGHGTTKRFRDWFVSFIRNIRARQGLKVKDTAPGTENGLNI
jgi:hypothetical protein